MNGQRREAEGEAGWLDGLPVSIKDLVDVAGVRTTYGSPIFRDHVPAKSHRWWKGSNARAGSSSPSRTPRSSAPGVPPSTRYSPHAQPVEHVADLRGSTARGGFGGHGRGLAGSRLRPRRILRRPGTYCSVVGLRPSAGRVTRGTVNNLYSPLSVQGRWRGHP